MASTDPSAAENIWRRALEWRSPSIQKGLGDSALATVLEFHSECMSSGVLAAIKTRVANDLEEVVNAYNFMNLNKVAEIIKNALNKIPGVELDFNALDELEIFLDEEYYKFIPADEFIHSSFLKVLQDRPEDFDA